MTQPQKPAEQLSDADVALLVRAAQSAGIDPAKLQARNPWTMEGTVALTLQAAINELDPAAAQQLQEAAGVKLSLGARAALLGLQPWTPELEAEVSAKAPDTYQQRQQAQLDAAAKAAFGGFEQREKEARELAAKHGYNVSWLANNGHHLAATIAAEHHDRIEREERQKRLEDARWMRQQEDAHRRRQAGLS